MIHSMAGGMLGKVEYSDFAKVEILQGNMEGKLLWYKSTISNLKVGDEVIVPLDRFNINVLGKVVRIDKNVSSQASPVPFSKAKSIIKIINK